MKLCTKCSTLKPPTEFHRSSASLDGLGSYCKACRSSYAAAYYAGRRDELNARNKAYYRDNVDRKQFISARWRKNNPERAKLLVRRSMLHRKYGLDVEAYADLLKWSNGGCAICGFVGRLHVDHCHSTGAIRGLLCIPCNTSLGGFRDSPQLLRIAIAYLAYFGRE
jgi:hypothetical protein